MQSWCREIEQGTQDTQSCGAPTFYDGVGGELAYCHHLRSAGQEVLNPVAE